jgi:hypothetical protein
MLVSRVATMYSSIYSGYIAAHMHFINDLFYAVFTCYMNYFCLVCSDCELIVTINLTYINWYNIFLFRYSIEKIHIFRKLFNYFFDSIILFIK